MPEPEHDDALLAQLREIVAALQSQSIRTALIGGIAVGIHARPRATHDVDLLCQGGSMQVVAAIMKSLGYEALDLRADLASFVRGSQRADFLFANRPWSSRYLAEARALDTMPDTYVVAAEALIAFKLQAFADDPRRLRDVADILEVIRYNRGDLDEVQLHEVFRLFDQEPLLDDILARLSH